MPSRGPGRNDPLEVIVKLHQAEYDEHLGEYMVRRIRKRDADGLDPARPMLQ